MSQQHSSELSNQSEQLRNELLQLNRQRNKIESEIKEWQEVLKTHNVGMTERLVDNEGFPRNDIDVYQVRTARNKIICLQNDARGIMQVIEEKMHKYYEMQPKVEKECDR